MSQPQGAQGSGPRRQPPVRRSRKSLGGRLSERAAEVWTRLLELPGLWVALLVLVGTWLLAPSGLLFVPQVEPGSIAPRDYVAPRDLLLVDAESTREKERRARAEVLPVYDFDSGVIHQRHQQLDRLFATGRELVAGPEAGAVASRSGSGAAELGAEASPATWTERLQAASGLRLTPDQVELLAGREFSSDLQDRLQSLVRQALSRGVVTNKELLLEHRMRGVTVRDLDTEAEGRDLNLYEHIGYPDELRDFLESEVRDWAGLAAAERRVLVDLLMANLQPNLFPNQSETLARREAAAAAVDRVFNQFRKGQVVVRKGDEVDAMEARVIAQFTGRRQWNRLILPLLGNLSLLLLVTAVLWLGLRGERVADHGPQRRLSEAVLLLLGGLLGAKFTVVVAEALAVSFVAPPFDAVDSYLWAVPYASVALVASLLAGRNVALFLSLLFSLLVPRLTGGDGLEILIYSVAGSLAAIFAVDRFQMKQRLAMTRIGLTVGGVNVVMVLTLLALAGEVERTATTLGFDVVCALAGGLLATAVASFLVPILESLFAITTEIKLIELANTNLPLLRRLAFEAPGTFQHSLMVANLAKEGCEAIGADAVLAYTGALYHDIGKVFRPDYYIENQRHGVNPHDKLQPSMSALILISHIKDGLELAREHHLPRPVLDAIEQHHGNRLISFFYNRARERSDPETGEVAEEKYRYPGPLPQTRVIGVLMLADAVEAASRTLVEPSPVKLRSLIRTIVEDCRKDGQLDATDLTLADLRRVSEAFLRVLANIFHQRVDYPGYDFNRPSSPRRERAVRVS